MILEDWRKTGADSLQPVEGAAVETNPAAVRCVKGRHAFGVALIPAIEQLLIEGRPWVYQVARSALADLARSRARHHPSGVSEANAAETVAPAIDEDDGDAERALATYMVTLVAALPSPYREAIFLTELREMSQKDAATMLGISLSAMKSRVRRGRQQIQEMLRACCDIALDARGRVVSYARRADGQAPKDCCQELKDCKC